MVTGILHKMRAKDGTPCRYELMVGEHLIDVNALIDSEVRIEYTGRIFCIQCGRKTSKSFQQGHCFPCFKRLQECGCMVKPENCRFYEGQCREDDWAHAHCSRPHVVYLANSSDLKVGITQCQNMPSRWLDQGASQALPFIQTSNRYLAGLVEVACKNHVGDKTNWRTMLKGVAPSVDLVALRDDLLAKLGDELRDWQQDYPEDILPIEATPLNFSYPLKDYPSVIKTFNFDKDPLINDQLIGIKAQYCLFKQGLINIRKFAGYEVNFG